MKSYVLALVLGLISYVQANFNVVILHTNDVHSRVEQTNKYSSNCSESDVSKNKCYGGVARRYTAIQEVRRNYSNVILLDAGDQFQGSIWFSYYGGRATRHFMNILQYDAMALGNHELDNGVSSLVNVFIRNASFPVLACNVNASREPLLERVIAPYTILTIGGQRVGVIGYITEETKSLLHPDIVKNLVFQDVVSSVQKYVDELRNRNITMLIGLSHLGFHKSQEVVKKVRGLYVVLDGHTNTFLYNGDPPDIEAPQGPYPVVVNKNDGTQALVYQAYAHGKYLGMADITFNEHGEVTQWSGNPLLLDGRWAEDPNVLEEINKWRSPLLNYSAEEIGISQVLLEGGKPVCRVKECNMGNLVTDAALYMHLNEQGGPYWTDVAIVIWNGGSIRATIAKGPITLGNILEVLPFRNEVEKVTIKGRTLRAMLEHAVSSWNPAEASGSFLQFSGMKVVYNVKRPSGSRVHDVIVRCADCAVPRYEPLADDKTYAILTNNFLSAGGDGYLMLKDNIIRKEYIGNLISDSVAKYIQMFSPIITGEEGRISFYDDTNQNTNNSNLTQIGYMLVLLCSSINVLRVV